MAFNGREMRSFIDEDGVLTLSLEDVTIADPSVDEVIVRVEAAPINPSDLGLMFGAADVSTMEGSGTRERPVATLTVSSDKLPSMRARIGQSLAIGNEGAGTVVAAGAEAKALEGKRVGMIGGAMYADYRRIRTDDVVVLPEGVTAAEGASMFVNPLTALGFVETMHIEGHRAIVHTAAASNLNALNLTLPYRTYANVACFGAVVGSFCLAGCGIDCGPWRPGYRAMPPMPERCRAGTRRGWA